MRKGLLTLIVVPIMALFLVGGLLYASQGISIYIDSNKVESDVAPQLVQDRTLVPLRVIAEYLGAEVNWVQDARAVEITSPYQKFLDDYAGKGMYIMQADAALPLFNEGSAVILDVRTISQRNQGYITDSLHIPLPELMGRIDELPTDKTIAVYCVKNINASYAVVILNMLGHDAYLLENGIDAWIWARGETTWPCPPAG